jgi:uncharacterized protein involved in outer membrane biogenesis
MLWMAGSTAGVTLLILLALYLFNWNMLRGPIARFASDATGRNVRIDGDLKVHLLTWQPRVSVEGLKVSQPAWVGAGDMATVDKLVVETRWMSLIQRKPVLPLLEIDHPILDLRRDGKGKANWDFSKTKSTDSETKVPPIERFIIDSGRLHYVDQARNMTIDGVIDSNERAGGQQAHAFSLVGNGTLNGRPLNITANGGPLINVKLDQPYPFSAAVRMADTRVEANGHMLRPFDLSAYATDLHIAGGDLADLYYLIHLTLPNTPTYDLHGNLSHAGKLYTFQNIGGRIGASDLAGKFTVSTASGRPFVDATLRSHSLDFKDLAALFGAAPLSKTGKATATPAQKAQAAAMAANDRLLPDAPLATERLRKMDARLDYAADTVKDTFLPLRSARLKLKLDHGLLTVDPLNFDFPQGSLASSISLDARGATPVTSVDARLTNVELKNFIPGSKGADAPLEGVMAARVKLTGRGESVHRAAAASNGAITVVIPHGHIRQAFAELLGVNAGKGLGLLLSKNNSQSDVRCGVASFDVVNGQMRARQIVFDTDVVRVNGTGSANLGSETFDLTLKGDSKKFRVTHLFLPITIDGHFRNPQFGVQAGSAVTQGGAAVALGALFTPLAAILPFVDPGLAKNADCSALMAEAKTAPAPVKGALPTTPLPSKK